jgi:hypothetical protein
MKLQGLLARLPRPSSPLVLATVIGLFALAGLAQVWDLLTEPYHYAWPMKDDYDRYHYWAVDVVENGLAMRMAPVPYTLPAGFLYVYFVAGWYWILGVHPPAVFIIQSVMLGGSVVMFFLAFRQELGRAAQFLLLGSLAAFGFLDFGRQYAPQLFSENLLVFEVAAFFYFIRRGFVEERRHRWSRILALAALGAIVLTRPNATLFMPAALIWLIFRRRRAGFWPDFAFGLAVLAAVSSIMAFRNHEAGGDWTIFPPFSYHSLDGLSIPGYEDDLSVFKAAGPETEWHGTRSLLALAARAWWHDPLLVARGYIRKILFLGGFLPVVVPEFRYRPHWMLMWAAFVVALGWRFRQGARLGPMIEILLIWLVAFLGPVIAIAEIGNYGFRYVVPGVLPAVAGAVLLMYRTPCGRSVLTRAGSEQDMKLLGVEVPHRSQNDLQGSNVP